VLRVVDLGADRLRSYAGDLTAGLVALADEPLPPGTGPRHGAVLADGRLAITCELAATLVLGRPGSGDWQTAPGSRRGGPARTRSARNYPGDLQADPASGQVYFANRGHDTIARFDVSGPVPRMLDECDAGVAWPQHLAIHRGHLLVAGWDSGQVAAVRLDAAGPARPILACPGACWLLVLA
jgi:6-phosphogluconolactonase